MANYNRSGWLDAAMAQVRSKPEHKAIRAELQGHLEDKEQYFLEKGMGPREAGKAAVEAMGDPVAVGKELDKAHPVWWAKLYTAAKAVILILCVVMLFSVVDYFAGSGSLYALRQNHPLKINQTDPYSMGGEDVVILDVEQEPITLSGYTVQITQAYWSPEVYSGEENVLEVDIKVSNPRPWAVSPLFMSRMEMDADEDVTRMLCVALSSGSRISVIDTTYDGTGQVVRGFVMDQWHDDLKDFRYWGSWYFTYAFHGVEPGDTITLYHPDHEELTMTFEVGVAE